MLIAQHSISVVYVSGPTHIAVNSISQRIHTMGVKVCCDLATSVPLVVRGYDVPVEMRHFFSIVKGRNAVSNCWIPDHWEQPLSLCEWLLKVVNAPGHTLAPNDKPGLRKLSREVVTLEDFEHLRLLVAGQDGPNTADTSNATDASAASAAADVADGHTTNESCVTNLLVRILAMADFVCTTPYSAHRKYYETVVKTADAVVLDEAGALGIADALMVWGPLCRPCVMAGDVRQLPPAVMDNKRNRFSEQAAVSVLEHFQKTGNPTFVLNKQMRITEGLFDLARDIIYPDVPDVMYGEPALLRNHPIARLVDMWAGRRFGYRPDPKKVLPIFINYSRTICDQVGTSRINLYQNDCAIVQMAALVKASIVSSADIVAITPYKSNLKLLKKQLARHPALSGVTAYTTDSYQGREGAVVFFIMVVTKDTSPLFVAHANRICVAITRHVEFLFIVGDISTIETNRLNEKRNKVLDKTEDVAGEDGFEIAVKYRIFGDMLKYFKDNKRVFNFVP